MKRCLAGLTFLLLATGCAGFTVKTVGGTTTKPNQVTEEDARGIRYYEIAPYLLVHTDNAGGLVTKLIYLPDRSQKRSLQPYNKLSKSSMTFTFKDGTMTNATGTFDSGIVPKAIVDAAKTALTASIAGASEGVSKDDEAGKLPAPYLYKIVVMADGKVQLKGGQPEAPHNVIEFTQPGK